uniref:NADH dehydrogenase subunit 5 n=1 Tax=Stephanitis chinensis TaxID=2045229 RepID=UPI002263F9F6|nr:NADH dehydrogenase subunit 5 [Stephanitis chinensis]UYX61151.1 NADH dehydrogenase subunit 5 [Stephanitis chinensis]
MYIYIFFVLLMFSLLSFYYGFIFLYNDFSIFIDWEVVSLNSVCVSLTIYVDYISLFFSGTVLIISSMVILYSNDYMSSDLYSIRFLFLVILFVMSMMFMIYSLNLISILLGWDGLGLVSYCLVIYYQNINSYISGMLTILTNRIGDVFILIGIAWFFNYGSFNFVYYIDCSFNWLPYFSLLMILASFTKSAQIPFSSWLPAAMAAPTPVSSLVHSSTLVTAGVYLLIRFGNLIMSCTMIDFFLIISILTMFMSGVGAVFEYDLKKIVAFSTLSQLGLMMSILFLGNFNMSYFHLLSHAFFKSLLFMCSGLIIHSMCDNQDIRYMGYIFNEKLYMSTCFLISNLSLCGLFFMSGFYSKDLIVESFMNLNLNFFIFFIYFLCISLTILYTFRLLFYFFNGVSLMTNRCIMENFSSYFSLIILVFFSLIFGSTFSWLIFETPLLYIFPLYMKLMIMFFMSLGFFLFLLFNFIMKKKLNYLYKFLGNMWYLNFLGSSFFSYYYFSVCNKYSNLIDDSWGECYISCYPSYIVEFFSLKLSYLIFNNLKFYFMSFFLFMIYFLI